MEPALKTLNTVMMGIPGLKTYVQDRKETSLGSLSMQTSVFNS